MESQNFYKNESMPQSFVEHVEKSPEPEYGSDDEENEFAAMLQKLETAALKI